MTRILFRFPGGRYHATPWGSHVNEGLIEWPPSPWRLLRAFIATAFTKLGIPDPLPPEHALCRLVAALAGVLPSYRLPAVVATHSRHYMPLGKLDRGREKTTLVLDTCAVLDDGQVAVLWPVELDPECLDLLGRIVTNMGYLGRAESWVEARLLRPDEPLPAGADAIPHTPGMAKGPRFEQVTCLAPISDADFADWRRQAVETVLAEALESLPLPDPPKKTGKALLNKREKARDKAVAPFPLDLFGCLTRDTAWLQAYGWNQPPGSRRVLYWRRSDALTLTPPRQGTRSNGVRSVEAVLIALASDARHGEVLPLFSRCLPQAELLHRGLVSQAAHGNRVAVPVLIGRGPDGQPLTGHRHLHILPLSLDGQGRVDHFLLWAPMGLDANAQKAILSLRRTWTKGDDNSLSVTVAGLGAFHDFADVLSSQAIIGPARVWTSRTPFVPPRHIKKNRHTIEDQVQAELASRGYPPAMVETLPRDEYVARHLHRFVRMRRDASKAPPMDRGIGLKLTFTGAVSGPICLGYASHFGLGLFAASPDQ